MSHRNRDLKIRIFFETIKKYNLKHYEITFRRTGKVVFFLLIISTRKYKI